MEPPLKRLRLNPSSYDDDDEDNQDELSMTPAQFDATQDPMYQLDKGRAKAATRLKSTFEDIFEKYGKDFDGDDDVINFYTDEIEVDNGHVQSLETRKEGDPDDSLSAEEEDRILSGKQSGRKKKSRQKSLVPTNYAGYSQRLQFQSPWNEPPGLDAPRLSSLAFSPYGSPPPFDLGRFASGNSHIDPVWQTPDLPFQMQQRPAFGIGQGRFDSSGRLSDYAPRRLVSAKSFLRTASPQSRVKDAAVEDEGDNIVLGRNRQGKTSLSDSQDSEKVDAPATATSGACSPSQLPPFFGLRIDDDELDLVPDNNTIEIKNNTKGLLATDMVLKAPESAGEGANTPHYQSSSTSPRRLSPTRRKRTRSKKSNTREFSQVSDGVCSSDPRALQPNERRIEIVIPIMKRLLQTTTEQPAVEPASPIGNDPQQSDEAQSVPGDHDTRITPPWDSPHSLPSSRDHDDTGYRSPEGVTEVIQNILEQLTARSYDDQEAPQEHSKQTHGAIDTFGEESPLQRRGSLEDTTQELSSLQQDIDTGSLTDNITAEDYHESGQKSDCDVEEDDITVEQQLYLDINEDVSRQLATLDTGDDGSIDEVQAIEHRPTEALVRPASPKETLDEGIREKPIGVQNLQPPDTHVVETARTQEESSSPSAEKDTTQHGPVSPVSHYMEDDLQSTCSFRCDSNLPSPPLDVRANDVLGDSEVVQSRDNQIPGSEQDINYQSPEHLATYTLTEYYEDLRRDRGSPNFLPSEAGEDERADSLDQPISHNDLVAEIDTLQLESDDREVERSCSPEVVELPDRDLSVFPTTEVTSDPALLLSLDSIENDDQDYSGMGRSPSPELGTPVRPKTSRTTVTQTNTSPTTPTRKQGSKATGRSTTLRRTPSSKRFPLTSLLPEGIDDESDDELSIAGSISSRGSRLFSPFFRPSANDTQDLPPLLLSTPRNRNRKHNYLINTPSSSSARPPATDSRTGRNSQTRRHRQNQNQNRSVHSSPLKRRVAERLLNNSSPIKRKAQGQQHGTALMRSSPSAAAPPSSPSSSSGALLRRCGEDGFECGRDFCFTCCI
ncbi:hypothetical protein F5Y08DRAFT_316105 [Xylaria arbuscula]|nr:hypothetical protein F5Y08DRAFT_316105 [Xylaria arbuscula]